MPVRKLNVHFLDFQRFLGAYLELSQKPSETRCRRVTGTLEAAWMCALRLWAPQEHLSSAMIKIPAIFINISSAGVYMSVWWCETWDMGWTGYMTQEERGALRGGDKRKWAREWNTGSRKGLDGSNTGHKDQTMLVMSTERQQED